MTSRCRGAARERVGHRGDGHADRDDRSGAAVAIGSRLRERGLAGDGRRPAGSPGTGDGA
ncbi:hypothetical protein ACFQ8C_11850 [Streptomyces sp. NPDC056503]|uniref:hypothetical protein n=1 Tax=Streptomyces sp. NPDC056503 TaxID=3345842 RepID=UPI00367771C8